MRLGRPFSRRMKHVGGFTDADRGSFYRVKLSTVPTAGDQARSMVRSPIGRGMGRRAAKELLAVALSMV